MKTTEIDLAVDLGVEVDLEVGRNTSRIRKWTLRDSNRYISHPRKKK